MHNRLRTDEFKPVPSALLMMALLIASLLQANVCFGAPKDHSLLAAKKSNMTNADPTVVMETTKGTIKIRVYKSDAPITAGNFLDLVQRGFYNGVGFHRYEPNFVIQGGDPKGNGTGGFVDPTTGQERTIKLETSPNLRHSEAGMVAMARSNNPDSASSQFYFTLAPCNFLDASPGNPGYAVFGKVVEGLNVVKELRKGDKMTKVSMLETATK
jgi:cyclophilin family peptidyl-prolyl cis-trans isomerase